MIDFTQTSICLCIVLDKLCKYIDGYFISYALATQSNLWHREKNGGESVDDDGR